jgi:hypothetical protein
MATVGRIATLTKFGSITGTLLRLDQREKLLIHVTNMTELLIAGGACIGPSGLIMSELHLVHSA